MWTSISVPVLDASVEIHRVPATRAMAGHHDVDRVVRVRAEAHLERQLHTGDLCRVEVDRPHLYPVRVDGSNPTPRACADDDAHVVRRVSVPADASAAAGRRLQR